MERREWVGRRGREGNCGLFFLPSSCRQAPRVVLEGMQRSCQLARPEPAGLCTLAWQSGGGLAKSRDPALPHPSPIPHWARQRIIRREIRRGWLLWLEICNSSSSSSPAGWLHELGHIEALYAVITPVAACRNDSTLLAWWYHVSIGGKLMVAQQAENSSRPVLYFSIPHIVPKIIPNSVKKFILRLWLMHDRIKLKRNV